MKSMPKNIQEKRNFSFLTELLDNYQKSIQKEKTKEEAERLKRA